MSEICFDCYNKECGGKYKRKMFVISRKLDLCEDCGEYKPTIIVMKRRYLYRELFLEWVRDMRMLYGRKK